MNLHAIGKYFILITFLCYFYTDSKYSRGFPYLGIIDLCFSWGIILCGAVFVSQTIWFFLELSFLLTILWKSLVYGILYHCHPTNFLSDGSSSTIHSLLQIAERRYITIQVTENRLIIHIILSLLTYLTSSHCDFE